MSVLRLPADIGQFRDAIRVVTETGVLMALGFFLISNRPIRLKGNIWIGLFGLLAVFSFIFPVMDKCSYHTRNCIFYGFVWYAIIVSLFTKETCKYLMWAMIVIALINVAFLICQKLRIDPYSMFTFGFMVSTADQPTGFMSMCNEASCLLAMAFPAFLINKYTRWLLVFIVIGFILSGAAGGMLAVYFGLIFYFFYGGFSWKIRLISLTLLFGIVAMLKHKWLSVEGRWDIWVLGWESYKTHWSSGGGLGTWFFGHGLGHWKTVTRHLHAHNDYWQVLFEMGAVVIGFIGGYITNIFRRLTKEALVPATALVIIIVHSAYSWLWCISTLAFIALTWMAILEIYLTKEENYVNK